LGGAAISASAQFIDQALEAGESDTVDVQGVKLLFIEPECEGGRERPPGV
jgi:hypothetical protein